VLGLKMVYLGLEGGVVTCNWNILLVALPDPPKTLNVGLEELAVQS